MDKYQLSIIIPHYNIPRLLEKLLNSIPRSDDIQVIVVDDNSTQNIDELTAVVAAHDFVEFYTNHTKKNSLGTCRNIGLDHALGKWVLFADADDYYTEGWIDEISAYFDSDIDMLFFSATSINLDTGKVDTRHLMYRDKIQAYQLNPNKETELLLRYDFASACLKMYRRSFLSCNNIRFLQIVTAEDTLFSLECGGKAEKIACTNFPVYCITRRGGSLTTVQTKEYTDLRIKISIKRYAYLYRILDDKELTFLGIENAGIQTLYRAIADKMGFKRVVEYARLLRAEGVPIINRKHANPFTLFRRFLKSVIGRLRRR